MERKPLLADLPDFRLQVQEGSFYSDFLRKPTANLSAPGRSRHPVYHIIHIMLFLKSGIGGFGAERIRPIATGAAGQQTEVEEHGDPAI